jgi:hypothetical protein
MRNFDYNFMIDPHVCRASINRTMGKPRRKAQARIVQAAAMMHGRVMTRIDDPTFHRSAVASTLSPKRSDVFQPPIRRRHP